MAPILEFSIPTPFETRPDARHPPYEAPNYLTPSKVHSSQGRVTNADSLTSGVENLTSCTLSRIPTDDACPSVILDYGVAVAGIPVLHISSVSSESLPVMMDISFSESFPGITRPDGDGPFPFSAGANTLRRTRFRLRQTGYYESPQVQGSQRWTKITLVSPGPCSVSLSLIGFKPTTSNIPLDKLPGYFECSDAQLSALWGYGARTLQLNCVSPRTVPPPWQISEDMGVLIDSQRCNPYGWGGNWTDYECQVEGMIIHDGLAWNVRVNGGGPGFLFQINLQGDSAILEMWYGFYNKPQITLVPILLESGKITSPKIVKGKWYTIKTVCVGTETISVYIDNILAGIFQQGTKDNSIFGANPGDSESVPRAPKGSVGIGAGQDQVCRFKNLQVVSLPSRDTLYSSGLNNPAALGDFGIGWNQFPYIFDGAKRDRYAWTADIITGGPALYYSTAASEHIRGNIEASILRAGSQHKHAHLDGAPRKERALLPGGVPPGREFERDPADTMFNVLTVNYSLYLIMVLYDYWMYTNERNFVKRCWEPVKSCMAYVEALVNDDGLVEAAKMDAGDYDYYNGFQTGISTKRNALYVSTLRCCAKMATLIIEDNQLSTQYLTQASRTSDAINKLLFNPETGHYNITDSRTLGFQQEAHSWLIFNNIAPSSLHKSLALKFKSLTSYHPSTNDVPCAPLSFSPDTPNITPVISPIMSTFHIRAALATDDHLAASEVLRTVWGPMCDTSSEHFTGTTWEFLKPDSTPFKDHFCSYAQLFSVGPTSILSQYVLGVEPTTAGYEEFRVHPRFPMREVTWAQGRVPTPVGEVILVRWQIWELGWRLRCRAPKGLQGTIVIPDYVWTKAAAAVVNGLDWDMESAEIGVGWKGISEDIDVMIYFK